MSTHSEQSALDFVNEDLLPKIRALYARPAGVKDEEAAKLWLEALARAIVTTSTNRALILQGWNNLVRTYRGKEWPVPGAICNAIEKLKPPAEQRSEAALARPDGKNAKGCGDFVQKNTTRILDEWWDYNSAWMENLFTELRLDESQLRSARWHIKQTIDTAARFHCQLLYWELTNAPLDLEQDFDRRSANGDTQARYKERLDTSIKAIRTMAEKGWPSVYGPAVRQSPAIPAFTDRAFMAKAMGSRAEPSPEPS